MALFFPMYDLRHRKVVNMADRITNCLRLRYA
ncbi:hypothetical protein FOXG_20298 [Fusarium oxysporum f. sp. lycopersici 4287]|uniref:Uncharacterized protein n=2 Tax=Fusarium oxysporum TaxID=5507 RepID=A0A0J9VGD7_FUSO4|nr:hypothetical protein FOXG_20298 [Fusarium oxysporum f. sp. lycopersici 4287]EXK40291.1 hypothetical protein FOMG_07211 [Fusarium oxysporum f. sp. melonis 26406]KNB10068.1 hypothetical protein FOXG_20298 [Fusarium oxysporum f. sp. lycopersici 4287]